MSTETGWAVLDRAHEILREVVDAAGTDDLDRPTPCTEWTVAQVIQHAAYDQAGYTSMLTGGAGPAGDPFAPTGRIDSTPSELLAPILTDSAAAWSAVDPAAAEVPTPVPPGALAPAVAAGACALDAAVHAWDLAVALGRPSPLTAELAAELMPVATAIVEPLRSYGVFAAAVEGADGDAADALLRYLGRRPDWTR